MHFISIIQSKTFENIQSMEKKPDRVSYRAENDRGFASGRSFPSDHVGNQKVSHEDKRVRASFVVDEPYRAGIIERETRARSFVDREALIASENAASFALPAMPRLPRRERLSHELTDAACFFPLSEKSLTCDDLARCQGLTSLVAASTGEFQMVQDVDLGDHVHSTSGIVAYPIFT